jgi:hypothetical protein
VEEVEEIASEQDMTRKLINLDTLDELQKKAFKEDIQKSVGEKELIYLGIDVGERFAFGATTLLKRNGKDIVRIQKIKMNALSRPVRECTEKAALFKKDFAFVDKSQAILSQLAIHRTKTRQASEDVCQEPELLDEFTLPSFDLPELLPPLLEEEPDSSHQPTFGRTRNDVKQHFVPYVQEYLKLAQFYNCGKNANLNWRRKRAIQSEYDRAVHQIVLSLSTHNDPKMGAKDVYKGVDTTPKDQVFIGIGSAKVKGNAGPFMRYLIKKLQSFGYKNIYLVQERFTSQRCPKCQQIDQVTRQVSNCRYRVKMCENCNTIFHRDVMAGHNIANIVKGYVEEGKRPDYLEWGG